MIDFRSIYGYLYWVSRGETLAKKKRGWYSHGIIRLISPIRSMSRTLIAGGVLSLLLLVGQGCPKAEAPTTDQKTAETTELPTKDAGATVETKETVKVEEEEKVAEDKKEGVESELKLSAEALGGQEVKLTWTAPSGLTEDNRFIIVRDELENPEHTGKNIWIRQHNSKREVVWNNVPTGSLHFRICLTENDAKDACAKYSNDVEVTVE